MEWGMVGVGPRMLTVGSIARSGWREVVAGLEQRRVERESSVWKKREVGGSDGGRGGMRDNGGGAAGREREAGEEGEKERKER